MNRECKPDGLISVGVILRPTGLKGKLKIKLRSKGLDTLKRVSRLFLEYPDGVCREYEVEEVALKGATAQVKLKGIDDVGQAGSLKNSVVMVEKAALPPAGPGEYYHFELIGMDVFAVEGLYLGKVASIFETGSNDVMEIKGGDKDCLVPMISDLIVSVDKVKRVIVVKSVGGLVE